MKVKCYEEGYEEGNERGLSPHYSLPPDAAARRFCAELVRRRHGPHNVCVEPVDDEARALGGWHDDGDGEVFRMFVVTPTVSVEWTEREVATFNPYAGKGAA